VRGVPTPRPFAAAVAALGAPAPPPPPDLGDPALAWAASGAMWLTGPRSGPPCLAPAGLMPTLAAAAAAVEASGGGAVDVGAFVAGRAASSGRGRAGRVAVGGAARLLRAGDGGWVALNLARDWDRELVPALVEHAVGGAPWPAVARAAARAEAAAFVARARLLDLPAAVLGERAAGPPWVATRPGPPGAVAPAPLVVDLSALWAGPACAWLLGRAGARVVKVEAPDRPDGARRGDPAFFDALHGGHESVVCDLGGPAFRDLLDRADVVIEASRPRALRRLGIDAEAWLAARRGRTWVSITGHGRTGDGADRVAFGDDAAVAGGLVARAPDGTPVFCADALADPVGGLYAAAAALASRAAGGGHLLDVALAGAAAHAAAHAPPAQPASGGGPGAPRVRRRGRGWEVVAGDASAPVARPRPLPTSAPARPAGADTDRVLAGC
jgi:hypothetical protein